jgi:hypothetical protein
MTEKSPILKDVDVVMAFLTASDKARQTIDTGPVAKAGFNLLAGFLINVQRIADAQERPKNDLLNLEQSSNARKL